MSSNTVECSFTITVEVDLAIALQTADASCFDFSDGQVTYSTTGGSPPYMVTLDPIQQDSLSLHAGNYHITIEDSKGCTVTDSFEIFEPEILIISEFEILDESNSPGNDGAVSISVTGGTPGYSYTWTKDGDFFSNEEDLTELNAGEYICIVVDANGCQFISDVFTVEVQLSIIDEEFDSSIHLFPNPSSGIFVIEFNDIRLNEVRIDIFNTTGKVIISGEKKPLNSRVEINHSMKPGLYFIRIQSDQKTALKRIIIQN